MVFIPHGTDQVLGNSSMVVMPEARGLVARAVLNVPEFRQRYYDRMTSLLTNVFVTERITNSVRQVAARIQPYFAGGDGRGNRGFEQRLNSVCRRVARREEFLRTELLRPDLSLAFDASGAAPLQEWKPNVLSGKADMETRPNAKPAQFCIAVKEQSSASWRSEATLPPGNYRFVGRVKITGVEIAEGDERGGACLRISRRTLSRRLVGTRDWTEVAFDFEVENPRTPLEFVCELRGVKGRPQKKRGKPEKTVTGLNPSDLVFW